MADIEQCCRAELFDFDELAIAIGSAGNSAIPLVKALGRQIAAHSPEAERYVHMGATSQDVMDSGRRGAGRAGAASCGYAAGRTHLVTTSHARHPGD